MDTLSCCSVGHLASVLGAVELGCCDEVGEGFLGFFPLTGLETAVWVDPELFWGEVPVM